MTGNGTELNIDVGGAVQNDAIPQVDFAIVVVQYGVVPRVDVASVPNNAVPQVDAPVGGGIQNGDVPQVDVIVVGDQNNIVSQIDQNDTIQQVAIDVEPVESSDDDEMYEVEEERRCKKRKYLRHTQEQYRELENFFLLHPRPTEKQRIELSMKLWMEMKQIKFWFQSHRTQMKTQINRNNNNTACNINPVGLGIGAPTKTRRLVVLSSSRYNWEVYEQYIHRATSEVMSMTHMGEPPLWVKKSDGEEELNLKDYHRLFAHGLMESEVEFVTEATRASDIVCINGMALVEIMMNVDRWMEAFVGLVASGTKLDTLSSDELLMKNIIKEMAGNGTELNIVAVASVQNSVVPQVNVVAGDDVQNVVVPQVDAPASCGIQNIIIPQVDFVAAVQHDVVPQVDVVGVLNDVVPQVDAPTVGGIQNADVPQVDDIAAGDQNDTVQQAGADVEPAKSSDDDEMYEVEDEQRGKKRKHQRHTQEQCDELEKFFQKYPHPTKKQRIEISMKIGMEMQKIKSWFQNRRTHMKIQLERHENILLRKQNDKLIAEIAVLRQNVTDPSGPMVPTSIAFEKEQLRAEVARLNEEVARLSGEVARLSALDNRYSRPLISPSATTLAPTAPTLSQNNNQNPHHHHNNKRNPVGPNLDRNNNRNHNNTNNKRNPAGLGIDTPTKTLRPVILSSSRYNWEVYRQYIHRATSEVMSMTHMGEPLWVKKSDGEEELNLEDYHRMFAHGLMESEVEFVTEATRASDIVCINGMALVKIMMNVDRWIEAFAGLVASGTKLDTLSSDDLLMIKAEFQQISPLIPVRATKFMRSCNKEMESVWSIIDISVDANERSEFLRLPSGCIIYDLNNGCSKVLWLEHVQYDESLVHPMMRPMVRSGMGFGARRWIATLQRYCECIALLLASSSMPQDPSMLSMAGKNSLMKLSRKMVNNFYRGISIGLSNSVWEKLSPTSVGEDVRILSRKNSTDPNEAVGIVLSGSTSLWLPVSRRRVFEFLMREDIRTAWDLLNNGGPLEEVVRIPKAQTPGNSVSILRVMKTGYSADIGASFILQETWNDATCSSLVYTTVDVPILDLAMSGGDSSFAALFPSGFIIFPDGKSGGGRGDGGRGDGASISTVIGGGGEEGCIMTAEFQILASTNPESEVEIDSVLYLTNLLTCTTQRINAAFQTS
ncbi:Homeobox-leucine zipper protein HDG1 [Linum perenne]